MNKIPYVTKRQFINQIMMMLIFEVISILFIYISFKAIIEKERIGLFTLGLFSLVAIGVTIVFIIQIYYYQLYYVLDGKTLYVMHHQRIVKTYNQINYPDMFAYVNSQNKVLRFVRYTINQKVRKIYISEHVIDIWNVFIKINQIPRKEASRYDSIIARLKS